MKKTIIVIVLILMIHPASAAPNPEDFIKALYLLQTAQVWNVSPAEEKKIGSGVFQQYCKHYKKLQDPRRTAWVQQIFAKLVAHAERTRKKEVEYQLAILVDKTVNAMSLPGGFVVVFTGLLDRIESDDELAVILAHELTHVDKKHSLKMMKSDSALGTLVLLGTKNSESKQGLDAIRQFGMLAYSRDDEDEADTGGVALAAKAGYNGYAMVSFMEKLMKLEGPAKEPWEEVLLTHPPSSQRAQELIFKTEDDPGKYNLQKPIYLSYIEGRSLSPAETTLISPLARDARDFSTQGLQFQKTGDTREKEFLANTAREFSLSSSLGTIEEGLIYRFEVWADPLAPVTMEISYKFYDQDKLRIFPDWKITETFSGYRKRVVQRFGPEKEIPGGTSFVQVSITGVCEKTPGISLENWDLFSVGRVEKKSELNKVPQFRIKGLEKIH
ncbi:MAG: M48 family metalloprotease [Candidatus Wallbacteria bacterium]|nr:M48 family metalloprotease [Candidatus Wallbacteria bacterium]